MRLSEIQALVTERITPEQEAEITEAREDLGVFAPDWLVAFAQDIAARRYSCECEALEDGREARLTSGPIGAEEHFDYEENARFDRFDGFDRGDSDNPWAE